MATTIGTESTAGGGPDWIFGGEGSDTIYAVCGSSGGVPPYSGLDGAAGDDPVVGENGNDDVVGGAGVDDLQGNAGNDTLYAEDGESDTLYGGVGTDICYVNPGDGYTNCEDVR